MGCMPSANRQLSGSGGRGRGRLPFAAVAVVCLALYAVDFVAVSFVPHSAGSFTANFAVPFDLMVCVPAVFYLLFVRRRGMTPIAVLPVIYLGGLVSAAVAVPGAPSALPVLLAAAFAVDAIVIAREIPRLVRALRTAYDDAKGDCPYPAGRFARAFGAVMPHPAAARMAAMEAAMWRYLLFSWRDRPIAPEGREAFSYHKSSGFLALVGVIVALGVVETIVVHLLVWRFSPVAAVILTASSIYALAWIVANARAVVLCPVLVGEDRLTATWGFMQCEEVPASCIDGASLHDPGFAKSEVLDLSTMGGTPCWVLLSEPYEAANLFGKTRPIRAIKLTPDQTQQFARSIEKLMGGA